MTLDDFIAAFLDEENAVVLRAHSEAVNMAGTRLSDEHHVAIGKSTVAVLRKNRERLTRMWNAMQAKAAGQPAPGPKLAGTDATKRTA